MVGWDWRASGRAAAVRMRAWRSAGFASTASLSASSKVAMYGCGVGEPQKNRASRRLCPARSRQSFRSPGLVVAIVLACYYFLSTLFWHEIWRPCKNRLRTSHACADDQHAFVPEGRDCPPQGVVLVGVFIVIQAHLDDGYVQRVLLGVKG